jgi:DNA-binding NarL/FixJ family response regulator
MVLVPRLQEPASRLTDRLQLLLVDRQPLFLAALAELITSACPRARVEVMTRSDRAIDVVSTRSIDLVFCEARAEPVAGAEVVARVNALGKATRVILLGDPEDRSLLVGALACGASGFFTKNASPEEILEGVDAVLAGHYVVGSDLVHPTLARLAEQGQADRGNQLDQLSTAERNILLMVGQAQSIRTIAASRGISQKTVRNHLASIYRKLELRNRSEAILWSARMGLTDTGTGLAALQPVERSPKATLPVP